MKPYRSTAKSLVLGCLILYANPSAICKDKPKERIIGPTGIEQTVNVDNKTLAKQQYDLALTQVKSLNYEKALETFEKIIELGSVKNPHYTKAIDWLDEKIWKHMIRNYSNKVRGQKELIRVYLKKADGLPPGSEEREELLKKAREYMKETKGKNKEIKSAAKMIKPKEEK